MPEKGVSGMRRKAVLGGAKLCLFVMEDNPNASNPDLGAACSGHRGNIVHHTDPYDAGGRDYLVFSPGENAWPHGKGLLE